MAGRTFGAVQTSIVRRNAADAGRSDRMLLAVALLAAAIGAVSGHRFGVIAPGALLVTGAGSLVLSASRRAVATALALVVLVTLPVAGVSQMPAPARAWGLAAVVVCLSPFVLLPLKRGSSFPYLHVYSLVQAVYLYVAVVLARVPVYLTGRYDDNHRIAGFRLNFFFVLVLVGASLACTVLWSRRTDAPIAPRTHLDARSIQRALAFMYLARAASAAVAASGLSGRLGAVARLPDIMWMVALLVLAWAWTEHLLRPLHKVAVVAFMAVQLTMGLGQGYLYLVATPLIALMALIIFKHRRVPWFALLIAVTGMLLANVVKIDFRLQRSAGEVSGDPVTSGFSYLQLTAQAATNLDEAKLGQSAFRFDRYTLLGYLEDKVPSRYPYWRGKSYRNAPWAFVPRALAPWKPKFSQGNEFGRAFGFLDRADKTTSENSPLSAEAFVNFGIPGVLVVAALAGAVLALASRLTRGSPLIVGVVGAVASVDLVGAIESGIALVLVVVPVAMAAHAMARWLTGGRRAQTVAA